MHGYFNQITDLICNFDGMCQPFNPSGISCYGFLVRKQEKHSILKIYEEFGLASEPFSKEASNNVAEYVGLGKLLEWLINNGYRKSKITICGDSQLIINQITGKYKVRSKKLMHLYIICKNLLSKFENLQIEWIPREKNRDADNLANKAYIKFMEENIAN